MTSPNRISSSTQFSGISATTTAFSLSGGRYGATATAAWSGGSVTLQVLALDGTTWIKAATPFSADGTVLLDLPEGSYRLLVVTSTAVYVELIRL